MDNNSDTEPNKEQILEENETDSCNKDQLKLVVDKKNKEEENEEVFFEVTTEQNPPDSPPLLLLQENSETEKSESIFDREEIKIPDQILAESSDKIQELDESTENEIASKIGQQLLDFDGSDDEDLVEPLAISENKNISSIDQESKENINEENIKSSMEDGELLEDSPSNPVDVETNNATESEKMLPDSYEACNPDFEEVNISETERSIPGPSDETDSLQQDKSTSDDVEKETNVKTIQIDSSVEDEIVEKSVKDEILEKSAKDKIVEKSAKDEIFEKSVETNEIVEKSVEDSIKADEIVENIGILEENVSNKDDLLTNEDTEMVAVDESDINIDVEVDHPEEQETKENILKKKFKHLKENDKKISKVPVQESIEKENRVEHSKTFEITEEKSITVMEINNENETLEKDNVEVQQEKSKETVHEENPSDESGRSTLIEIEPQNTSIGIDNSDNVESTYDDESGVIEEDIGADNVDDIEKSQGADEEVCLLPDTEEEISEADKERAILAKEAAEKETLDEEMDDIDKDVTINSNLERNANKSTGDLIILEDDQNADATATDTAQLKEFEIKENTEKVTEKCFKCSKIKPCLYRFLKDGEIKYMCHLKCVSLFRTSSKEDYVLIGRKIIISDITELIKTCSRCRVQKKCRYRFINPENKLFVHLCDYRCLNLFTRKNADVYVIRRKKYIVEELSKDEEQKCLHCDEVKDCKYFTKQDDELLYICSDICFNVLVKDDPDRFRIKRRSVRVRDLRSVQSSGSKELENKIEARTDEEAEAARLERESSFIRTCAQCLATVEQNERTIYWETMDFCNEVCLAEYQNIIGSHCTTCKNVVSAHSLGKYCVRFGFDIRQFCYSSCLDKYKKGLKVCSYCQKDISNKEQGFLAAIGDKSQFKDFCSQFCMKKYEEMVNPRKKLKSSTCAVCAVDKPVRVEIILDDREFYLCSNPCLSAFKFVNNISPDACNMCLKFFERKSSESFTVYQDKATKVFCCKICMNIYIILNRKIVPCQWCKVKKYNFDMLQKQSGNNSMTFCSLSCLTLYNVSLNAISICEQNCNHCQRVATPQYHLTMSDASVRNFCTYQCVMLFQSQFGRTPLTLDDLAVKQKTINKNQPFPTGLPKRIKLKSEHSEKSTVPVIANVTSLANNSESNITIATNTAPPRSLRGRGRSSPASSANEEEPTITRTLPPKKAQSSSITTRRSATVNSNINTGLSQIQDIAVNSPIASNLSSNQTQTTIPRRRTPASSNITVEQSSSAIPNEADASNDAKNTHLIVAPPQPVEMVNKKTMCKPATMNKSTETISSFGTRSVECQTDNYDQKAILPIPIPVYAPFPMWMYSMPFPIPVPIPIPIPVPIFIPTTRNSAQGIMKEIQKIQDKMPNDPYEAELLMMAEMVAADKKKEESDSDSENGQTTVVEVYTENIEPAATFGEDVLQMALKMATEYDEPAVDLESAMTTSTITAEQITTAHHIANEEIIDDSQEMETHMIMIDPQRQVIASGRPRKRILSPTSPNSPRNNRFDSSAINKKIKRIEMSVTSEAESSIEALEKPDANMCLKYTFGVNAWKQWVVTKNADLEKSTIKRKPFKSELLQMTADELNYSLCLFVKEVRKPNGSEYAPDTIYYLVLGIQQYLYENNRIDNIFTDPYYERFTDCLDEVAQKFSILYTDRQYIVTRVEEEHLWECKQLGAHSPHVLLSTLMFFNTKHFNLTTVEEHMQLSFSHIMKHWKRVPPNNKTPGSRNVLLRFYPPQMPESNPKKKKVYEQQENEANPLRCPVKLYEFYLSKCPESVKTRNDVFYLQPERSCVPDSPVWYSTQPLSQDALIKMLHRVKMVKEINVALLTS